MKVAAFLGSPRKNGNTARLIKEFLKGAAENSDIIIDEIFLRDKKISGCTGCEGCKKSSGCVVNDDMQELYPVIKEAEVLVFAMPVYWWSIPGHMKCFIDRFYGLKKEEIRGKKVYVLMTYGGALPNSGPELVERTFRDICEYIEIELVDIYGVCTDDYIPVAENTEALNEVYILGKTIR